MPMCQFPSALAPAAAAALAMLVAACGQAPDPAASAGPGAAGVVPGTVAELILSNGEILTPAGWVPSMAVKRGVIVALGDDAAVAQWRGAATRIIDLQGAAVVPGLHDMHAHPTTAGMWQLRCMFPQGSSADVVAETIKACVEKKRAGEWVTGGSWDAASFGATPPHRSLLDRVSPDNPVVLNDISGHSSLANSKALELAGITKDTPNPPGGIIERDADGVPTGVLRESAGGLLRGQVPPPTAEDNIAALKWALDLMLSQGITSFRDAVIGEDTMQAYASLFDQGLLKQRVKGCLLWSPSLPGGGPAREDATWRFNLYARERFAPDCIKIILDGVPTDGHTAAMLEPYADALPGDTERARGMLLVPPKVLNDALVAFDGRGITVKIHAAGDAAVRTALDAIEFARKTNGQSGIRHEVGHNSFVSPADLPRPRQLGVTMEMSPYIWYPNAIIPDIARAVGPGRMKHWTPVRSVIEAGALAVPGSDWPVVPSVNPWVAIETLVTRQVPGGGGEVLAEAERITLEQAVDLFTINSARAFGNSHRNGRIELGMLADVLVLDRNIFRIPVTDIHKTTVKTVIINGEVVYQASK